jgi:ADP-heptose:LPS heptosyltransferase
MIERTFKRSVASILRFFFRSISPAPQPDISPRGILVIRQHNQLGDMLCVVPLLRALRARYPGARLDLMASPVNQEVMLNSRLLDGVVLYDKRKFLRNGLIHPLALFRFIRSIRGLYDMVLVPGTVSTSFTSDFLAFLTGANVRLGVESLDGRANSSSYFFTTAEALDWRKDPHRHQTLRNLDVARSLAMTVPDCSHELTLTPGEIEEGKRLGRAMRGSARLLIGFHPGAGKVPNRWPAEKFAELIDRLSETTGCAAFITSGPMDEDVVAGTLRVLKCQPQVIANQEIRRVASIITQADLYVTNDTGVMHISAGVGTPTLALFGPTDPLQWAPLGERIRYIHGEGGEIGRIGVEEAYRAAMAMLGKEQSAV